MSTFFFFSVLSNLVPNISGAFDHLWVYTIFVLNFPISYNKKRKKSEQTFHAFPIFMKTNKLWDIFTRRVGTQPVFPLWSLDILSKANCIARHKSATQLLFQQKAVLSSVVKMAMKVNVS